MKNSWLNNLNKNKLIIFLENYFKNNNKNVLINIIYINNTKEQKFIEVETFDKQIDNDYFETAIYLGDYFILNPNTDLNFITHTTILNNMENYQNLNKEWLKFLYNNTKNIKINNKTYKDYLTEKLDENLLYYYENNMAFVINKYLKNENSFTESATFDTLKQFKKEYEEERKNLPNIIKVLIGETNKEEHTK